MAPTLIEMRSAFFPAAANWRVNRSGSHPRHQFRRQEVSVCRRACELLRASRIANEHGDDWLNAFLGDERIEDLRHRHVVGVRACIEHDELRISPPRVANHRKVTHE
jgi:hypothetical protein